MADQHQVNALMATAICDCFKDNPDRRIDPEQAKHVAKCVVAALTEAGLAIVVAAVSGEGPP
jgi:predicted ATPase